MNSSWPKSSTKRATLGIEIASHHPLRDPQSLILVVECPLHSLLPPRQRSPMPIRFDDRSAAALAANKEGTISHQVGKDRGVGCDDDLSQSQLRLCLEVLGDQLDPSGMNPILRLLETDQGWRIFRTSQGQKSEDP